MKTIICTLSLVLAFSFLNAQSSSSSKVSISSYSSDDHKKNYRISISITNEEDTYQVIASFPEEKTEKLKRFLKDHLETNMTHSGSSYYWHYKNKGETGYKVKLKRGKLNAFLDKELVSLDMVEDFMDAFQELKEVVKE